MATKRLVRPRAWLCLAVLALVGASSVVLAQSRQGVTPAGTGTTVAAPADTAGFGVVDWLRRMHDAARTSNYVGTFVVSTAAGNLSAARIWHACEADLQIERVDALSGPPRSTFRRGDRIQTFFPDARLVKAERRDSLEVFPNLRGATDAQIEALYSAQSLGQDRVAGLEADVVQIAARDAWRYGYRIWSERRSGLIIQLQTLDAAGKVVEQSAFTEIELDAPLSVVAMARTMDNTTGYTVQQSHLKRTSADKEGWALREEVPGFKPVSCYRRAMPGSKDRDPQQRMVQWTFSDGLATVSLFMEPAVEAAAREERLMALGATHTLMRRLQQGDGAAWWVTAVGEVPASTLEQFVARLVRPAR